MSVTITNALDEPVLECPKGVGRTIQEGVGLGRHLN